MQSGRLKPEQVRSAMDSIERNAHTEAQLIDDLLDLSRITEGRLHLDVSPVDIRNIVRDVLDGVQFMAEAKNIKIDSTVDETIEPISGDARRIQQILWNLLINAVKFTPKGGHVTLKVQHRDANLEIQVHDTGQGIAPEFLPFAFDAFRQEKDDSRRPHGGLGLGLAIVKQLTELHGGSANASSPGIGRGSTFTVVLPATPAKGAANESLRNQPAPANDLAGIAS